MKTVKRKAEVGETVKSLVTGRTGKAVRGFEDGTLEVFHESASYTGNIYMSPGRYEVIIEDEPEEIPPHSSHYHQNGLDPLEVMRRTFPPEQYEGFLRGSLLKYTMRYDRKGQQQADLEKLNFYGRELEQWKTSLKDVNGNVIEAEDYEDA